MILPGESEVHEAVVASDGECFAERFGDAGPDHALPCVGELLRRAEVVGVDVVNPVMNQFRDGQGAEIDVFLADVPVMPFGDQVALFVIDKFCRVVAVIPAAGFGDALAEGVGCVIGGPRAHALIDQAGKAVAGVVGERPADRAAGLGREVAVGGVGHLQVLCAGDALQPVRGRAVGVRTVTRARPVAPAKTLRERRAGAVAVGVIGEGEIAVGAGGGE